MPGPTQDILINWTPHETRVAVIENSAVQELHVERALERGMVGNIYAGRVVRVLPGMQSAFIDIGLERAAFLNVADLQVDAPGLGHPSLRSAEGATPESPLPTEPVSPTPMEATTTQAPTEPTSPASIERTPRAPIEPTSRAPIERRVFEGQTLTVQVIKDPIGSKGARLSTQISIAGRLLVFLPQDDRIGISQKIGSQELREQLRARLGVLVQLPEGSGGPVGGFILRTNAEDASDEELGDDIRYLRKTWAGVRERSFKSPPGTLLHQDLSLVERVLRDLAHGGTQAVRIDSQVQFEQLRRFGSEYTPTAVARLEHYAGERPIFDLYNIDAEIERALARRVDLKSGGYLIIDQTEALTTIDVNTGGFVGARSFDDTIFRTNLEASQAIARQLRLRNLGGIIVIDFIDMTREDHRVAVLGELRKQLARDRTKTTVSGFSQLGLVEMTRKRTRESLAHLLCGVCTTCSGKGQVKTARSVCYDILREILREARQFDPKEFRIVASAAVVEMLLDEESQHLAGLSDFIGKPISLQAETLGSPERYDIVLM